MAGVALRHEILLLTKRIACGAVVLHSLLQMTTTTTTETNWQLEVLDGDELLWAGPFSKFQSEEPSEDMRRVAATLTPGEERDYGSSPCYTLRRLVDAKPVTLAPKTVTLKMSDRVARLLKSTLAHVAIGADMRALLEDLADATSDELPTWAPARIVRDGQNTTVVTKDIA